MKQWHLLLLALSVFLITHLYALTNLPVFADEAIYIRWAQLIMDEPLRYAFFPLNDGKTPLFIWFLVPLQYLFSDPLLAGRIVAVLGGAVQLVAALWVTRMLGGKKVAQVTTAFLITFLPYWFFHHRLTLMDGWLSAWITIAFGSALQLTAVERSTRKGTFHTLVASIRKLIRSKTEQSIERLKWITIGSLCIGTAFWTKLPAVLAVPALALPSLFSFFSQRKHTVAILIDTALIIGGGIAIFALLIFVPSFPQLFSRGGDFLFSWQEVFLEGKWRLTVGNIPTYIGYFTAYLSPAVIFLPLLGLSMPGKRTTHLLLLLAGLGFVLPIAVLGASVYPRYLLPGAIFFTLSMSLAVEQLLTYFAPKTFFVWSNVKTSSQRLAGITLFACLGVVVLSSVGFVYPSYTDPNTLPLVSIDRKQYLTEWSSGHGVKEAVALIRERSQHKKLAVATEGFFGTLPDAALMYLHGDTLDSIWLEGVGQPVGGVTHSFLPHAEAADEVWLVVNSHRLLHQFPDSELLAQYCRPYEAPCLQIWDITEYAKSPLAKSQAIGDSDNL